MIFNGFCIAPTAAELTMAEKGISSAKVILTGFVVVFSVLLLLIGIIKLYSFIVARAQGRGRNKKETKTASPKKTVRIEAPAPVAAAPEQTDEIPEETVAVIAAAVAALYGGSGRARIKSIKRTGGRSAWANAGVLDNTRPF